MSKPKMRIVIDTREYNKQQQKIVKHLEDLDIVVDVQTLKYGDYFIGGALKNYLIERKTIFDLAHSWKKGRLGEQLKGLKSGIKKGILPRVIIEGSPALLAKENSGWGRTSVVGIMNSILEDWGVPYIYSPTNFWTALNLRSLCLIADNQGKKKLLHFKGHPKGKTEDEITLLMVTQITGVGETYGQRLLEKFPSIHSLCHAPVSEMNTIKGIDQKTATYINLLLHHNYQPIQLKRRETKQFRRFRRRH